MTIADVARASGVSTTTVSHVLTGKRPVAAATQERVRHAVAELGYRPSRVARQLRMGSSQVVAVVVPDITNPFYGQLTRGLADALGAPWGSYVCNTDGSAAREQFFLSDAVARGVDGIVISSAGATGELAVGPDWPPLVTVGGGLEEVSVDGVLPADREGAYAAVQHLLARGARHVAMVVGSRATASHRLEGYQEALRDHGLEPADDLVAPGDFTRQGGRVAMTRLMRRDPRPDAVFCANDLMAIGALDAARELGLRVPDDVRLVGFDDIEAAAMVSPALTTVVNPAYQSGWAAGDLLKDRLVRGVDGPRRTVSLPCRLVVRESG
ncbi:LacI family DNA-binding transcriptional regulator [Desertihabitans aurantiacus]|uniref:LacI family DNA-binding transcriptional regulator n=1 Tax=Desertihabitans aurantiacus TaxID=2282477 RepID=UPI0013007CFB|nr:LacI family DNA-binding transcriptional regulator [Desertihabitans aurantiacus]